jgi:hypothetical protein
MRQYLVIFATGFAQVLLVSANTYFISRTAWVGIATCGFGISYLWTFNVRKVAIGTRTGQFVYSTGAMLGGLTGVMLAKTLKQ